MRGHVRQHGKGFQAIVYAGLDPDTGKKKYLYATRASQREAEDALVDLMVKVRRGEHLVSDCTVAEMVERWFANLSDSWSPSRRPVVRNHIDSKIKRPAGGLERAFGDRRARDVKPRDLDLFYGRLRRGGGRNGRALSRSTVQSVHEILTGAYQEAIRCEVLTSNPAARASVGAGEYREARPPSDDELERLLAHFEDRDHAMFTYLAVSADAGNRRCELHACRWSDFDADARELRLRAGIVYGDGGLVLRDRTKGGKPRRLILSTFTVAELARHRRNMAARALAFGAGLDDEAFVFSDDPACRLPWKPNSTTQRFRRARRKLGVDEKVRLYDLRHYVASVLIASGVDITTVSKRLGHSRVSTTLDIYSHLIAASDHAAADVLDRKRRRSS